MKYIKIAILAITVGFCSCSSDYLEVQQYFNDMLTVDTVFTNKTYSEQWLWSTYSVLRESGADISNKGYQAFNFASDDAICGDRNNLDQRYQNCEYSASSQWNEDRWARMYQGIRKASIFINKIDNCKEMSKNEREDYRGQARFLRAYFYWMLMRQYGPVPILPDEGQNISLSYEDLSVARSSWDECAEYVVAEFKQAATVLPPKRSAAYVGQITRGAALAARAKVLLYTASPFYNGNTDFFDLKDNEGRSLIPQTYSEEKWARAAAAAKEVIDEGTYELLTIPVSATTVLPPAGKDSATFPKGWGGIDPFESYRQMFNGEITASNNPELIFFRQNYGSEDLVSIALHSVPFTLGGWNTNAATLKQVNAYYMCDGRPITSPSEKYPYDKDGFTTSSNEVPFLPANVNKMAAYREPRFYASIAYNGSIWENLSTTKTALRSQQVFYYKGDPNGKLLSAPDFYVRTGFGIKKYYHPEDSWNEGGIRKSKPEPAIRYADVLLWYAEALNELTPGKTYSFARFSDNGDPIVVQRDENQMRYAFSRVRFRAGLPDLDASIYHSQDEFRRSLKHERQIELFFEAARYYDLRRWKDADVEENMAIMGCNVDMSSKQRALFYKETPTLMPKLFIRKMYLWPLPKTEMDRDVKLTQNPEW